MGHRHLTRGYVVLDALLAVFVAGVTVVAAFGLFSAAADRAVRARRSVVELVKERSVYAETRPILFSSEE